MTISATQQPLTLTQKQAAELVGIGVNQMGALVRSGRIRAVRTGRRWLITREAIQEFLKAEK